MKLIVALLLCLIFFTLALLHVYWAFSNKKAFAATIPTTINGKPFLRPGRWDCLIVAIVLIGFGGFVLIKTGLVAIGLQHWLFNYSLYAIGGLFLLRAMGDFKYVGFFKKIKTTRFGRMDTKYYSPLCLLIGMLCLILMFLKQ